ncbi:MAG: LysR family transcriptional regulator [Oscillospiraceae bacterium]|jgi:DNA-binding transcriptional LysR family regulator
MELLQLKYFTAVAETLHMTRTAERLNISQSTLSRTISRLEKELGVKLFYREGRSIQLTDYGRHFLERARRALRELNDGQREIEDLVREGGGELTLLVSVPEITGNLLEAFHEKYPGISVSQHIYPRDQVFSRLERGEGDLGFAELLVCSPTLQSRPVLSEQLYVVLPINHPLAGAEKVSLTDLEGERVIFPSRMSSALDILYYTSQDSGYYPNLTLEVADYRTAFRYVGLNWGISFASSFIFNLEMERSKHGDKSILNFARGIPIAEPYCSWDIGLTSPKNRYMSRAVRSFYSFTLEYFRGMSKADLLDVTIGMEPWGGDREIIYNT